MSSGDFTRAHRLLGHRAARRMERHHNEG
jgi:hypothetical protein